MTELALATELTPVQRNYLGIVRSSADSLLTIINDILDLSKIEAGKLDIERIPYSLRSAIRQVLEVLSPRAMERKLTLNCSIADPVQDEQMGDPVRIRQVLTNLISNAIKFSEGGSIDITVNLTQAGQLEFCVQDHGIGIAPDKLERIFESFSQADSSTTRKFGGTGLGLTICKHLVALMQGRIWVESTEGVGSRFYFTVVYDPRQDSIPQPGEQSALVLATLSNRRVLVIEDHVADQHWLADKLQQWSMLFDVAPTTAVARRLLTEHAYDAVILDLQLPDGSGVDLLRDIRSSTPSLPVVVLSALGAGTMTAQCLDLGARVVMHKPVSASELYDTLTLHLHPETTTPVIPVSVSPQLSASGPSLQILVAEDNAVNQMLIEALLQQMGHQVTLVENGALAVADRSSHVYDLVFMDMHMPVMSGLDAARRIREMERAQRLNRIPIIALTANAMRDAVDDCIAAGMDGYVCKPIQIELLKSEMSRCLENAATVETEAKAG